MCTGCRERGLAEPASGRGLSFENVTLGSGFCRLALLRWERRLSALPAFLSLRTSHHFSLPFSLLSLVRCRTVPSLEASATSLASSPASASTCQGCAAAKATTRFAPPTDRSSSSARRPRPRPQISFQTRPSVPAAASGSFAPMPFRPLARDPPNRRRSFPLALRANNLCGRASLAAVNVSKAFEAALTKCAPMHAVVCGCVTCSPVRRCGDQRRGRDARLRRLDRKVERGRAGKMSLCVVPRSWSSETARRPRRGWLCRRWRGSQSKWSDGAHRGCAGR